ncbi:MAG: histidine--tRNA ligase [Acidiferrobacterales bacterium]|nr:histidine--tRNA ligase [Acidiferrobacterales bacterium]
MSGKKNQIKAIRGMNDILPSDSSSWLAVERVCTDVLEKYSYRQIRTPLLESTHLFTRSIGSDTDIVAKEMYTFEDRNGDSLSLRPEGTASCVRAGIENGLFYNQVQRLWYIGPMFRHERPQKGRYRQFHQIGVESYGWSTPDIEAEILSILSEIFIRLELRKTHLQINSLGDVDSRNRYRQALVDYLKKRVDQLDEDSQRRLTTNPLRILDSKNDQVQKILSDAPNILDFLSTQSKSDFEQLQIYLNELEIPFSVNPKLVRGLDYYNNTVFEWVNEDYGAQATVCGGGRYDNMVEQLGGSPTPGFGFGMGLERLVQILQEQNAEICADTKNPDIFLISIGEKAKAQALVLQRQLASNGISVNLNCGQASMKNQFKKADKSGAIAAFIIGEDEAEAEQVGVKTLIKRDTGQSLQQTIPQKQALNWVTNLLESL